MRHTPFLPALALLVSVLPMEPAAAQSSDNWGEPLCSAQSASFTGTCSAPADVYEFTLRSFRMRREDGTFLILSATPRTFNAAGVSIGAEMGAYVAGASFPAGTYNAMSPVLDNVWRVRGTHRQSVDGGPGDCTTTATGFSTNPASAAIKSHDMGAQIAAEGQGGMVNADGDIEIMDTDEHNVPPSLPITVDGTQAVSIDMQFWAGKGVNFTYNNGVCTGATMGDLRVVSTFRVVE